MNSKENIEIISSLRNVTEIVKEALDKNAYRAAFFALYQFLIYVVNYFILI